MSDESGPAYASQRGRSGGRRVVVGVVAGLALARPSLAIRSTRIPARDGNGVDRRRRAGRTRPGLPARVRGDVQLEEWLSWLNRSGLAC